MGACLEGLPAFSRSRTTLGDGNKNIFWDFLCAGSWEKEIAIRQLIPKSGQPGLPLASVACPRKWRASAVRKNTEDDETFTREKWKVTMCPVAKYIAPGEGGQ